MSDTCRGRQLPRMSVTGPTARRQTARQAVGGHRRDTISGQLHWVREFRTATNCLSDARNLEGHDGKNAQAAPRDDHAHPARLRWDVDALTPRGQRLRADHLDLPVRTAEGGRGDRRHARQERYPERNRVRDRRATPSPILPWAGRSSSSPRRSTPRSRCRSRRWPAPRRLGAARPSRPGAVALQGGRGASARD